MEIYFTLWLLSEVRNYKCVSNKGVNIILKLVILVLILSLVIRGKNRDIVVYAI